jgi:hypothetical protein
MNKKFSFIVIALLFILQSCKKAEIALDNLSAQQILLNKYLTIYNAKDGSISMISQSYNFKNNTQYTLNAGFENPIFKNISLNNVLLSPNPDLQANTRESQYVATEGTTKEQIASLFGKEVQVSLNKSDANLRNETSIFNPSPFIINGGPRNTQLSWNAGNNGNVYILIRFHPNRMFNEDYQNYAKVERFIETNDDGAHNLSESDFAGIPVGGFLDIAVVRGRTALAGGSTNGNGGISIQAISTVSLTGTYGGTSSGNNGNGSGGSGGNTTPILHLP